MKYISIPEKQITYSPKTHLLVNNDNFSPDGKYLFYDTREMVYNNNYDNYKSLISQIIINCNILILTKLP